MSSYEMGKDGVRDWILRNVKKGATCLDVGACDGNYSRVLGDYLIMDAIEVYEPNVERNRLTEKYRKVFVADIRGFKYKKYKVVVFGDVIEHMSVEEAQECLEYAKKHSDIIIAAVPFKYKQGPIYGNPYERHVQDDLTDELFMKRYPGFERLFIYPQYGYYLWRCSND